MSFPCELSKFKVIPTNSRTLFFLKLFHLKKCALFTIRRWKQPNMIYYNKYVI